MHVQPLILFYALFYPLLNMSECTSELIEYNIYTEMLIGFPFFASNVFN